MPPTEQQSPPLSARGVGEADQEGCSWLESPTSADALLSPSHKRKSKCNVTKPRTATRVPVLDRLAQVLMLAAGVVYVVGHLVYLSPAIQIRFMNALKPFWGVPLVPPPAGSPLSAWGDFDMLLPSFFVLFTALPFLASLLFFEFVRDYNVHRHTARRVLAVSALLRRKPPRLEGFPGARWVTGFCYGELLFLSFLVVGNIAVFVYGWTNQRRFLPLPGTSYTFDTVLELAGIVFGYSSVFNFAFLFLPCTRHCAWLEFFNISYANGIKYHRWLGVLAVVTAVLHALPFYWLWGRQGTLAKNSLPCWDCKFDYNSIGYPKWFNVFGEISLFFLLALSITSIPWVRRRLFETFYYAHHLYIPAVVFAVLHWNSILWWLLPTLLLYLASRAISRWNSLFPVQVLEFTRLPEGLVKIVLARRGGFDIGQFVYLNVPAISKLQWHAFTISSSPRSSTNSLTILSKSLGNWTEDLVEHTQLCQDKAELPLVYMDGYYGASLAGYDEYPTVCLIGGGIGSTPLFAILEDMAARLTTPEAPLPKQRVFFVLAIRELALLEEIHPVLQKLKRADPHGERFSFRFNLTRQPNDKALGTSIDYDRLQGDHNSTWTMPSTKSGLLGMNSKPFTEPLRSRKGKSVLYAAMVLSAVLIVVWLQRGGGLMMKRGKETQYWPLQNFVEIGVLFVVPIIAYTVLFIERQHRLKSRNGNDSDSDNDHLSATSSISDPNYSSIRPPSPVQHGCAVAQDAGIRTLGDLVREYNVACGTRPNMESIMREVHDAHKSVALHNSAENHTVGVFISGPEALKMATDDAIATLGAPDFDVHEEEFEL